MNSEVLTKCGFSKDENNLQLAEIFQDGIQLKEIHIDIYSSSPFDKVVIPILMLRRNENNATILNDGKSIVIKANDKYNTYIAELLLNSIKGSYFKMNFENSFDFILNCQNIYYKVTIFK